MEPQADDAIRVAVSGVLSAGGVEVLDQPARFRSMLSDVLAASGEGLRQEQTVLVTLVERGVASELVSSELTEARRSDLVAQMRANSTFDDRQISSALDAFEAAVDRSGLRTTASATMGSPEITNALQGVLAAGGRAVLSEPARFRSMLADLLGSAGSSYRTEQTALAGLIEHGVGTELLEASPTPPERAAVVERLEPMIDAEPPELRAGVDALDRAVTSTGLRERDITVTKTFSAPAARPPVPPSEPTTILPSAASPAAGSPSPTIAPSPGVAPPVAPAGVARAAVAAPAPTSWEGAPPAPFSTAASGTERKRRAPVLIGVGIFVVIVLVAVATLLVARSGNGGTDEVSLAFATEQLDFAELDRTWTVEDGELVGTLDFTNDQNAASTGAFVEAFPKSLAATDAAIQSDPKPTAVLQADPVLSWNITLDAGATTRVTYRIDVPDDTDAARLETWQQEQRKALDDYNASEANKSKLPTLIISQPEDGVTVNVPEIDIAGITEPGNTISIVNVAVVTLSPDGTWAHKVSLSEGANQFTIVAGAPNGLSTEATRTVVYMPPPAPPTTAERPPTTTTPPKSSPAGTNTQTSNNENTTETNVTPPSNGSGDGKVNKPVVDPGTPIVANNDSYGWTPYWDGYQFYSAKLTVLDNDSGPYNYVQAITTPQYGQLWWDSSAGAFYYKPYYNGYYTDSFTYYLYNSDTGQVSGTATVYLTVYYNAG
jgi:hypothetical protein